ncbi:hypothetical protein [Pseudomonas glycinae]|nr:hypothetical protein [Pseudomonas glycinae]
MLTLPPMMLIFSPKTDHQLNGLQLLDSVAPGEVKRQTGEHLIPQLEAP